MEDSCPLFYQKVQYPSVPRWSFLIVRGRKDCVCVCVCVCVCFGVGGREDSKLHNSNLENSFHL